MTLVITRIGLPRFVRCAWRLHSGSSRSAAADNLFCANVRLRKHVLDIGESCVDPLLVEIPG